MFRKLSLLLLALLSFGAQGAITEVGGQAGGAFADEPTSATSAYGSSVISGNLLVAFGAKLGIGVNEPFVAGDVTKSAGTATVGTVTMDASAHFEYSAGNYISVAVFSVPVTGTGSLTLQLAGGTNEYLLIGRTELAGADISGARVEDFAANTAASGTPDSGNADSAGGAYFAGGFAFSLTDAATLTPDAAFAQIFEQETQDHTVGSFFGRIVSTGTTDSASMSSPTVDFSGYAGVVAVYKAAAAAGSGLLRRRRSN